MRVIKGVCFDMDGTLTVPVIDFAEMRRRVGLGPADGDILTVIDAWPPARRAAAYAAIAEVEAEALARMEVMPGVQELCAVLDAARVPRALLTRNVSASVDFFHATFADIPPFFPALSREWTPYKPDPAALHHIAGHWGVDAADLVMVGDSAKDDVVCANRAGSASILLDTHGQWEGMDDAALAGEMRPTFLARSMTEVAELLQLEFVLEVPPHPEACAGPDGEEAAAERAGGR